MCRKFTQHGTNKQRGCNLGKKCKDFHPKMCFDSIRKGKCFSESCRHAHIKGTTRKPKEIKNDVTQNNNSSEKIDETSKSPEPNHFLEVVGLLKKETLDTLNQRIDSMKTQIKQLRQTHLNPLLNSFPPQLPMQTIQLPRPHLQISQQSNPIHFPIINSFAFFNVQGLCPQTVQSKVPFIKNLCQKNFPLLVYQKLG